MFGGKSIPYTKTHDKKISSLTQQLQDISYQPQNPFREFAKFDGNVRIFALISQYFHCITYRRFILGSSWNTSKKIWNFLNHVEARAQ